MLKRSKQMVLEIENVAKQKIIPDFILASIVICMLGVLPAMKWLQLFPLVEFRSQIFFNVSLDWLWQNITFRGENIWATAFYFNSSAGRVCGTNISCLNSFPIGINLLTAVVVYGVSRALLRNRVVAALSCAFWLLSVPYLDTIAWQGTSLDKIAAFLTALAFPVALYFYRQDYSLVKLFSSNFALLFIVTLAYNAKPSSWVLLPGLWLMPVLGRGMAFKRWSLYLILPTIYGGVHNLFVYRRVREDKFYYAHTTSGDPIHNLKSFVGFLSGSLKPNTASTIIFVLVILVISLGLFLNIDAARFGLWCLVIVAGGIGLSIRTAYGSPFYMMVTQVFFIWAFGSAVIVMLTLVKNRSGLMYTSSVLFFLAAMLTMAPALRQSNVAYRSVLSQSDNFRKSFAELTVETQNSGRKNLKIVIVEIMDYKFVEGLPLALFISPTFATPDKRISWITKDKFDVSNLEEDTAYAIYDNQMNLSSFYLS